MYKYFFLSFLFLSSSCFSASLRFESPSACLQIAEELVTLLMNPNKPTLEEQIDNVTSVIPKSEQEFWIQLAKKLYSTELPPIEFGTKFYNKCIKNKGLVNLGDET